MPDTRRKTGPTPTRRAACRAAHRPVVRYPWDLPETAAQRERIVARQGDGWLRAFVRFGHLPAVTVLRVAADEGVLPQGTRSRRKAERRAAR